MFDRYTASKILTAMVLVAGGLSAATLTLGPVAMPVNGSGQADLGLQAQGALITQIQFDLEYDDSSLRINAEAGAAALKAGKDVSVNGKTYVIAGLNQNAMGDGTVVVFRITARPGASGAYTVKFGKIVASDKDGNPVPLTGSDATVTVGASANGPLLTSVTHGASFQPGIAASTWITLFGSNLAPNGRMWTGSDFIGSKLPTSLDGVKVYVNNKAAYVYYISPMQVNVLAPDDDVEGQVTVQVVNSQGQSSILASKKKVKPGFFMLNQAGRKYIAAFHVDGMIVGPAGLIPGVATRPAKPGDVITFYGTGFGPTNPPLLTGEIVTAPAQLAAPGATIQFGGSQGAVLWAGLIGAGLNQINVRLPADLKDGDIEVVVQAGGETSATGTFITVSAQ